MVYMFAKFLLMFVMAFGAAKAKRCVYESFGFAGGLEHRERYRWVIWEKHVNDVTVPEGGLAVDYDGDVVLFLKEGDDILMSNGVVLGSNTVPLFAEKTDKFI